MKNCLIGFSFLFLHSALFANPQFDSEIAAGDANVANMSYSKSFAYNPAVLASHSGISFSPLFAEFNFNRAGESTLRKYKSYKHLSDYEIIALIKKMSNTPVHVSAEVGGSFEKDNFGVALASSTSLDSIIRGMAVPVAELDITERISLFLSYAYPIYKYFSLGLSLKPSYKLDHHIEKNAITLADNPKVINPFPQGKRGEGLGLDAGFKFQFPLTDKQTLFSGFIVEDIGNTAYTNFLENKKYSSPPPDLQSFKVGAAYQIKDLVGFYLSRIEIMYAYFYQKSELYEYVYPQRLGMNVELFRILTLAVGSYKGRVSFGLKVQYKGIELAYANYSDVSTNISKITPDHRQGLAIHLEF